MVTGSAPRVVENRLNVWLGDTADRTVLNEPSERMETLKGTQDLVSSETVFE